MDKKHGITLMVVAIIVVVMLILVGVIAINGSGIINSSNKSKFEAEITQIQSLVKSYKARNNGALDFDQVTIDMSKLSEKARNQYIAEFDQVIDDQLILYEVDLNEIDANEVNYGTKSNGNEKDRYLVSLVTGKVYYEQGVVIGDEVYHKIGN